MFKKKAPQDRYEALQQIKERYSDRYNFLFGLGVSIMYLGVESDVLVTSITGYTTALVGVANGLKALDAHCNQILEIDLAVDDIVNHSYASQY